MEREMYAEVVNALTSTEERIERTEQQEKQTPVRNKEPLWPMHLISLSLHSEFPFFINYFFFPNASGMSCCEIIIQCCTMGSAGFQDLFAMLVCVFHIITLRVKNTPLSDSCLLYGSCSPEKEVRMFLILSFITEWFPCF